MTLGLTWPRVIHTPSGSAADRMCLARDAYLAGAGHLTSVVTNTFFWSPNSIDRLGSLLQFDAEREAWDQGTVFITGPGYSELNQAPLLYGRFRVLRPTTRKYTPCPCGATPCFAPGELGMYVLDWEEQASWRRNAGLWAEAQKVEKTAQRLARGTASVDGLCLGRGYSTAYKIYTIICSAKPSGNWNRSSCVWPKGDSGAPNPTDSSPAIREVA